MFHCPNCCFLLLFCSLISFVFAFSFSRYVLGHEAMRRLGSAAVLVAGMGGLGAEIAKNVALAGVGQLVIQDTRSATYEDLSTNFFLTEKDVQEKRNRADAVLKQVAELNSYVRVTANTTPLSKELIKNYNVIYLIFLSHTHSFFITSVSFAPDAFYCRLWLSLIRATKAPVATRTSGSLI